MKMQEVISPTRLLVGAFMIFLCGHVYATEHWSAEVGKITILENKTAYIIVSNPRNGPSSASPFSCTQNAVYLGVKNTPVGKEYLSQVMMVYATGKALRFGVRGTGDSCEAEYVTAD